MRAGDVVAERFEILRTGGVGGMGTVYQARDRLDGRLVALKTVRRAGTQRDRRFAKEAEALLGLRHPRIVRYVAHGRTGDGDLYLAMEWVEGVSLSRRLRERSMRIEEAHRVALGVADALAAAHQHGMVHRDVKPGNILLADGGVAQVKLVDFGLARLERSGHTLTATGELLGTPGYMAPEQARGDRDVDARADVFSLGCVLFRCLTGRRAFEGDDALAVLAKLVLEDPPGVAQLRPGIPMEVDDLVTRMLAKDRDDRPADGAVVARQLRALDDLVQEVSLASMGVAAAVESMPSLTVKEQQVMCLVLARPLAAEAPTAAEHAAAEQRVVALPAAVQPYGGRLHRLIDGTVLIEVGAGPPAEQALRAGRCALSARAVLGHTPMALAAGRGMVARGALLGKAIDRAAALLALGRSDAIRIDEAAAALVREQLDIRRDADGYHLAGMREHDEHTRKLLGKPTRCVGRARELSNLEALLAECAAEPVARAVLVTAPAGYGKSRVRYELLRRLRQRGVVVDEEGDERPLQIWMARGDPMTAGAAFGILSAAVRDGVGMRSGEPLAVRRRKVFDAVAQRVPPAEQQRVAEFLGELAGAPFDSPGSIQLAAARDDLMLMGDQMRRAFEDLVAGQCRREPLLLVLEDLHWGDRASIGFIDSVLRNLRDVPLMVLAFARPEVHELFPDLWAERDLQQIRLSRLTRKASVRLVREALGRGVSDTVIERMVEHAEGNAFFLEELIRAAAAGRSEQVPESVLAMVEARLAALDPEARRVLRAASVFGQVFWSGGVEALLGRAGSIDATTWLGDLTDRELITRRADSRFPAEVEYIFRHALVREAAYASLTDNDRRLGHALAGRWLEAAGEDEAMLLAEHYQRGDEAADAAGWYRRAAAEALEGNDLQAALDRADRAVDCGAIGEELGALRLLQAGAHRWRGEFEQMERCARQSIAALAPASARWCRAAADRAVACRALGQYDGVVQTAESLAAIKPAGAARAAYLEAASRTAMQLFIMGWSEQGDALVGQLEPLGAVLLDASPAAVAWLHHARAFGHLYAGDPGGYLQHCERAVEDFSRAGDLRAVANARVHLGFAHLEVGGYAQCERALRLALDAAARMGLLNVVVTAENNLGMALARQGALDEAAEVEADAVRLAAAQQDKRMEGGSRHYLATILALQGKLEQAESEARAAVTLLQVAPPLRAHALATVAEIAGAQGRGDEALALAREAMALLEQLGGIEEGEAKVRRVHAEALAAAGDQRAACAAIATAVGRLHERAAKICDAGWRASFLEKVADNARTLSLARAWGVSSQDGAPAIEPGTGG